MGVSMNPETFVKGGLVQDVDVEVLEAVTTLDPPEHYTFHDRVFTCLTLKNLDTGEEFSQHWATGANADFKPSNNGKEPCEGDGNQLCAVGSATSLRDNSNWSVFLSNLVSCGYPKEKLEDGVMTTLKGLQVHLVRVPGPERTGLAPREPKKPGMRDPGILVPNKLIKLPWEKAATKGRAATKAATAAPSPSAQAPAPVASADAPASDATEAAALEVAMDKLGNGVGPIPIAQLKTEALRRHMKAPVATRNGIVQLVGDKAWLEAQGFTVTGEQVQLA
jgi:hypothetical protein